MAFKEDHLLDDTGWQILRELQKDARLSFPVLGRRVGLSSPAVAERVRKLEEAGIITGYHACVNTEKVGLPMMAFIRINAAPEVETGLRNLLKQLPEMLESHRVTGSESFIVKVAVSSVAHLERVLNLLMRYGPITTSIVLSSPHPGEPIKQEAVKRMVSKEDKER